MKLFITRPAKLNQLDPEDSTVSEAIYTIYKDDEGWMLNIDWHNQIIKLDGIMISQIYNDIVKMLVNLESGIKTFKIFFLDTGLTAEWRFSVEKDVVRIEALWTSVVGSHKGEFIDNLRKNNIVIVSRLDFIESWIDLLKVIKEDLLSVGYTNELEDFEYLEKLL